jgi:hypothetical protein
MAVSRLAVAAALLAMLGGLWLLDGPGRHAATPAADYPVWILDPSGQTFWNGTVHLGPNATALAALQAAGTAGNFSLQVEQHPAFGAYVRAIGPYAETSTGGWNFCVDSGQGWRWVPMSAGVRILAPGERVQWHWWSGGAETC